MRRLAGDGTATYYLQDGSEYTEDGNDSYFTYYHQINGQMVAFTNSDTSVTTWTGADIVGSTSVTRDQNGNVNTQRYTPFGEVRTDGNLATDHTYTGQVFDQGTGLGFYNARYYDPVTGRFITPDSLVPNPLDGQDYNRYTYVRNNPIRYNDPTGHCAVGSIGVNGSGCGLPGSKGSSSSSTSTVGGIITAGIGPSVGELLRDLAAAVLGNPTPPLAPWELYGLSQQEFNTCSSTPAGGGTRYDYCDAANLYGTPNAFPYNPAATAPATQPTVSAPNGLLDEVASNGLWSRSSFNGTRVYQRNDLIDPGLVDGVGRSNLDRMNAGLAPIGPDGKSINLHHALQTNDSAIVEMTQTFHQTNSRVIHINPSRVPSGIDRSAFNAWRGDYWRSRACDFGGC